jgi:hypothetical protein
MLKSWYKCAYPIQYILIPLRVCLRVLQRILHRPTRSNIVDANDSHLDLDSMYTYDFEVSAY